MNVLHLNTQFAALGGVEAVLQFHHEADHLHGMSSRFISLWEPHHEGFPRARFLDFTSSLRIAHARRLMADAWPGFSPDIALHHTPWGQPFLLDLDHAARRVLMLHSDVPALRSLAARRLPFMDGAIGVSDVLVSKAKEAAPGWSPDRFLRIDYPVHPPAWLAQRPRQRTPSERRELVLGFAGRLESAQKRVERFIELSQRLATLPIPWRIEFLGDGSLRPTLEAALPDRLSHRFLGRLSHDAYWRAVASWDAIVFTSDFEGTPIALIEAVTAGVVPFHPNLGCGGDDYSRLIDPGLVYAPGDMEALANSIAAFASWEPARHARAVESAKAVATRHDAHLYLRRMATFLSHVASLPSPAARPASPRWFFPLDRLRFSDIERLSALAKRVRSLNLRDHACGILRAGRHAPRKG